MRKAFLPAFFLLATLFSAEIFAAVPTVTSITPPADGTYQHLDTLTFVVNFSANVDVVENAGEVRLKFKAPNNQIRQAEYISGTGTSAITFQYIVNNTIETINDNNGIRVGIPSAEGTDLQTTVDSYIRESIAPFDDADEDFSFDFTNVAGVILDSNVPEYSNITITAYDNAATQGASVPKAIATDGNYHIKADDRLHVSLDLVDPDTSNSTGFTRFSVGGGTNLDLNFGTSNTGQDSNHEKLSTNSFLSGDGVISITNINFEDTNSNSLTSLPGLPITPVPNIIVDTTAPVIDFSADDVAAGPVTSDTVNITVVETNPGTYEYGFSADNVCDGTDTYGNAFTSGAGFTINTETNNGNYICAKATDLAGNESFQVSANPLNIDITAPVFDSISVSSDNAFDASYGRNGSQLTFTLTLNAADSFAGPGAGTGRIFFDIGSSSFSADFSDAASGTAKAAYTATYNITTENGAINVTGIDFDDNSSNAMTGFIAGAPTPTVLIDTDAPTLDTVAVATTGNPGWARDDQDVTYQLNFNETVRPSVVNSSTDANNASTLEQDVSITSAFATSHDIVFEVDNGDNGTITINSADFSVVDQAGNALAVNAAAINALAVGQEITADTERPTVTTTRVVSNNALDTTLAKTNDTITVTFVATDNLSSTIVATGGSRILDSSVTETFGASGAGMSIARFTDGTETSERQVNFRIRVHDEAGNTRNINDDEGDDGSTVQFDRTDPFAQSVEITATSVDNSAYTGDAPIYYAKTGDTIDFSLQVCDYVDANTYTPTGTIFGSAVNLTDDGLLGTTCTTPTGNLNGQWRAWSTQLTNVDGTEGTIPLSITIRDNAGNGLVTITTTTNGSQVIFDKTNPTNPTTFNDQLGAETDDLKHRSNAIFSWSGQNDPNLSAADAVAGVWKYKVRLTNQRNAANGGANEDHRGTATNPEEVEFATTFDGQNSNIPDPGQTRIPAREQDEDYQFRIITVDKAGNHSHGNETTLDWSHGPSYEQPYSIGIFGVITNERGFPLKNVQAQSASRYTEICNTGREVCTGVSDEDGNYSIVLKKQQDYNTVFFGHNYYLYRFDGRIELDDIFLSPVLQAPVMLKEAQRFDQTITIVSDQQFFIDDIRFQTDVYVSVLSGQITTEQISAENFLISSLSTITNVTSNNPAVVITDNGNNTFTVEFAGQFAYHDGGLTDYENNPDRLGVEIIPANGKNTFSQQARLNITGKKGKLTWAESLAEMIQIDSGFTPKILSYINSNGFEVFAGYLSGKLPISKLSHFPRRRKITTVKGALKLAQEKRNEAAIPKISAEKLVRINARVVIGGTKEIIENPYEIMRSVDRRRRAGDEAKSSIVQKRYKAQKVNKFARFRKNTNRVPSQLEKKNMQAVAFRINGQSVSMEKYLRKR